MFRGDAFHILSANLFSVGLYIRKYLPVGKVLLDLNKIILSMWEYSCGDVRGTHN